LERGDSLQPIQLCATLNGFRIIRRDVVVDDSSAAPIASEDVCTVDDHADAWFDNEWPICCAGGT
jgi:hypothetical protein